LLLLTRCYCFYISGNEQEHKPLIAEAGGD